MARELEKLAVEAITKGLEKEAAEAAAREAIQGTTTGIGRAGVGQLVDHTLMEGTEMCKIGDAGIIAARQSTQIAELEAREAAMAAKTAAKTAETAAARQAADEAAAATTRRVEEAAAKKAAKAAAKAAKATEAAVVKETEAAAAKEAEAAAAEEAGVAGKEAADAGAKTSGKSVFSKIGDFFGKGAKRFAPQALLGGAGLAGTYFMNKGAREAIKAAEEEAKRLRDELDKALVAPVLGPVLKIFGMNPDEIDKVEKYTSTGIMVAGAVFAVYEVKQML
jgi:hypothetical protein